MLVGYSSDLPIPSFTAKFPFDSSNYLFDFSGVLVPGDTIASLGAITVSPSGLVAGPGSLVSGQDGASLGILTRLSSGSPGTVYSIMVQVYTTGGDQFARPANLPVQ